MAILIKKLILVTLFIKLIYANSYTYLLQEYEKETELESKIVLRIARDILDTKPVQLYIPKMKPLDDRVYSKEVKVVKNCKDANFIFVKYTEVSQCSKNKKLLILTNNYKQLLSNSDFIGAFFWSKSRPNIVLVKQRLKKRGIDLPKEYNRYIEDLD